MRFESYLNKCIISNSIKWSNVEVIWNSKSIFLICSLFGAFILLLILCTLIIVEKIDKIQSAFLFRRKVQKWDEEKLGGIFTIGSVYSNNKVCKIFHFIFEFCENIILSPMNDPFFFNYNSHVGQYKWQQFFLLRGK